VKGWVPSKEYDIETIEILLEGNLGPPKFVSEVFPIEVEAG